MNYQVEKAEKSTLKITITLDQAEWEQAQQDAYNKTKGKYSVPGFRKGKAPKKVLESTYGVGIFFEEAINISFPKYYYEVLDKEQNLEIVSQPSLELGKNDNNGITYIATVAVKPEVKLGDYKGIKFDKVEYNVTDEDIEKELKKLQERNSRTIEVTDRACANGDTVVIDYSGSVDGVKFDGGTAEKQNLTLGSGSFIPGFEDQVVGMNIGEERDITVKFPEEYHAENLKGKDAVFHIVLHEIKATELPEINDDFIKEADGAESLDAYKEKKRKELQDANDKRAQRELEDAIVKKITANAEMEIPDAMIENQIDHMVQEMEYRFMYQGLRLEDYLKYTKQTIEQYRESFKEQAGEIVKQQLVIDKILTVENIDATEEEVEEKIKDMAEKQGKKVPEFKKGLPEKQLEYLKNEIIITKLFDFLKKENTIA